MTLASTYYGKITETDPGRLRKSLWAAERQALLQYNDAHNTTEAPCWQEGTTVAENVVDRSTEYRKHCHERVEYKLVAVMLNFATSGIALTAVGTLLPDIERFYHLNDGTTALIFPAGVAGYVCATLSTESIHFSLGRRGIAWLSPIFRLIPVLVLSTGPPFGLALATYLVFGFGTGLTDSGWCAWASALPYANIIQGLMHGSFSLGSVLGPFAAIAALKDSYPWYALYRVIAILVGVEFVAQIWAFRHENAAKYHMTLDDYEGSCRHHPLRVRTTWMCGLFYFVYISIEASFSDWIVIYMERIRDTASATAGLAPSIFWIGMAIGRIALGPVTEHFDLNASISSYILLSICTQALFRFTRSTPIFLALLGANGFFLAPLFPSGIALLAKKLPEQAHVGAVAAAAAMGQLGAGVAPLLVGFMADHLGINRLLDVMLGLSGVMLVVWTAYVRCG